MKKISIILGSALVMLTTGCATDVTTDVVKSDRQVVIGATIEDLSVRTVLGDKAGDEYPVLWSAGDKIAVNGEVSEAVAPAFVGGTTAQFTVADVVAPYNVIYPAEVAQNNCTRVSFPAEQAYVENSFALGAAVMAGYAAADENVDMKVLCGFVKVTLKKVEDKAIKSVTLATNNLEAIAGEFAVDCKEATMAPLAGVDYVKVTGVEYNAEGKAVVVLAVPAGTYEKGFAVVVDTQDGYRSTHKAYTATGVDIKPATILNMPEVEPYANEQITEITDAATLQAFLTAASGEYTNWKNENGEVILGADIDLAGVAITPAASFDGVFNGNGYVIKNWESNGAALFTNLAAGGLVKNVVIDESCSMNVGDVTGDNAFVVATNMGTVSGCVNNANITFAPSADLTEQYKIGSIVGTSGSKSEALVTNCINNGNITVIIPGMTSGSFYFGGVVANTSGVDGVVCISNCINNGVCQVIVDGTNGWKNVYLGGVCGCFNNKGTAQDCENNANVIWYLQYANTGAYPNVGGITGYSAANITRCVNRGNVSLTADKAGAKEQITRPALGGISGYVNGDVTDCVNYGDIALVGSDEVKFGATTSYSSGGVGNMGHPVVGGVCGSVGYPKEGSGSSSTTAKKRTISGCKNYGTVTSYTPINATWIPLGGVVALPTGTITDCENFGTVKMVMGGAQSYVGGVYGCTANAGTTITNCHNHGKVWFADSKAVELGKSTTRSYLGGVSGGYQAGTKNIATNCTNDGEILAEAAQTMIVAGVFAAHNGLMDSCTNAGTVTVRNATALDGYLSEIGGIVGYTNYAESPIMVNCQSLGSITNECAGTDCGGLIAAIGGANTVQDCTVNCAIVAPDANVGLVIGSTRAAAVAVTLGADGAPVTIKSTTTVNGTPYTAETYSSALYGRLVGGASVVATNVVFE